MCHVSCLAAPFSSQNTIQAHTVASLSAIGMAALFRGGSVKKKASTEAESPRKIVEGDIPGQIFFGGSSAAWTQSFKLKNPPTAAFVPASKVPLCVLMCAYYDDE